MSAPASTAPLLDVRACTIRFGGLTAVNALDLQIQPDQLFGLIGPNGAGKTTVFNLITGVYEPTEGGIAFGGHDIHGLAPYEITEHGIARTFQNIRLFPSLSVFDNVRVAFHLHVVSGVAHSLTRGPVFRNEEKEIAAQVMDMLELSSSGKFADAPARACPTATSAGWKSSAPSPRARSCCCWMNPPPA